MRLTDTTNAQKPQASASASPQTKPAAPAQQPATMGRDTFQRSNAIVGSRPNVFQHQTQDAVWAGIHCKELLEDPGFADSLPASMRKPSEFNRTSSTGEDLPALFKQLHDTAKGQHVYLDIDSHGGGGNGVVFTSTDPADPTTRVVNAYSIAYINRALAEAGFKPEDITLFYEGCNSATAAYRTSQGFTSQGKAELQKNETRWQKEDFPGTKQVKISFHDVEPAERGQVVEFPAVGRMTVSNLSVGMQFRLGKAQLTQNDWTTGIYWIDHQKKAPRFLGKSPGLDQLQGNRPQLFNEYEKMAKKEAPSLLSRLFGENR